MLTITIPIRPECYDEENNEFIPPETVVLDLEHSLVSISKWESKWCKAFLSKKEKTNEETLDYIKCMTLTPNVDPDVYNHLTPDNADEINTYIEAKMTATHIHDPSDDDKKGTTKDVITSELIYYWMISLNIPFECQYWHLNKLLALVNVCNIKNTPPDKQKTRKPNIAARRALNEARKAQNNSKG